MPVQLQHLQPAFRGCDHGYQKLPVFEGKWETREIRIVTTWLVYHPQRWHVLLPALPVALRVAPPPPPSFLPPPAFRKAHSHNRIWPNLEKRQKEQELHQSSYRQTYNLPSQNSQPSRQDPPTQFPSQHPKKNERLREQNHAPWDCPLTAVLSPRPKSIPLPDQKKQCRSNITKIRSRELGAATTVQGEDSGKGSTVPYSTSQTGPSSR